MLIQPLPVRNTRFPMPTVGGLLVAASTSLVYVIALRFDLGEAIIQPLDRLSLFGISGDALLLVLSYFGFAMLLFSIQRQRRLKRTTRALSDSEHRFRALIENSADGIALIDAAGKVLHGSPATRRILGIPLQAVENDSVFDLVHPNDLPAFQSALGRLLEVAGRTVTFEFRARHRDGSWRWLEATATNLLADPSVGALVANFLDITDRKVSHERIQQQVGELEAINHISNALRAAVTLQEMLDMLIDETLSMVGASIGSIWLYDKATEEVRIAVYRGGTITDPPPLRRGEGIPGTVVSTGLPHCSRDFSMDTLIAPQTRALVPSGQGGACIPIRSQTEAVGVLFVEVMLPRELSDAEVRLLTTISEIAGIAIHRLRLFAQTERRLRQLTALREIDLTILSSRDLSMTLNMLLGQISVLLDADAADVLLLKRPSQVLEYAAATGFRQRAIEQVSVQLGQGAGGRAALERRTIVASVRAGDPQFGFGPLLTQEGIVVNVVVPLIAKGMVTGVLGIFKRSAFTPDAEWLSLAETLAGQAALAIDNAQLFDSLQRSNVELTLAYDATIEGWSHALDLRDKETEGHTRRVTDLTLVLARAMGIDEAELVQVRRGTLLHDIGKMGVPDRILLKPGPLSEEEWVVMRMHPDYAHDLLSPIAYLRPALDIPYCHHEKWDGTGYPRGLSGEQIPRTARIFAVMDVWDALRSDRPYRNAWPVARVRAHIQSLSGSHFDPAVVDTFLKMEF